MTYESEAQDEPVSLRIGRLLTRTLGIGSAIDPSRMICKVTTALFWMQTWVASFAYNAGLRASANGQD